MIWEDNFDSGKLDTTSWSYETGTGVNGTNQLIKQALNNSSSLDISTLKAGSYIVWVNGENCAVSKKIVVE